MGAGDVVVAEEGQLASGDSFGRCRELNVFARLREALLGKLRKIDGRARGQQERRQ
jgi:hypothetical protein